MPTKFRTRLQSVSLVGAMLLAGALPACSDNNDGPAAPNAATTGQQLASQQSAEAALSMINEMVAQGDNWSQGTFGTANKALPGPIAGARTQSEAVWDPEQQAWTWSATINTSEGANTVAIAADYWVQFRDGTTPQQYPDTATDDMEAHSAWSWVAHVEQDGTVADLDVAYQASMVVSGLHTSLHAFVGEGSMTGSAAGHNAAAETFEVAVNGSWNADLQVPTNGGCPSGTAAIQSGPWHLTATYDGSPTVAWELRSGAHTYASGTQSLPCGALSATAAQEQSTLALDAVNDLVAAIPGWLQGAPGTPAKGSDAALPQLSTLAGCEVGSPQGSSPLYAAEANAWTWNWNLGCQNADNWFTLSAGLWLQYRNGETPQMEPTGANQMEVRQTLDVSAHTESAGDIDEAQLSGSMQVTAAGVDQQTITVTGNGSLTGRAAHSGADPQFDAAVAMEWQLDLALPAAGGCPSGYVVVSLGDYTLNAAYDGGALAHWTLTHDGVEVGQGSSLLNCAN